MTAPTLTQGIRPPKQARSADTLARIITATRSLLDEMDFADVSISRIMNRAGMSVGSFYTPFPSKDALLPYLYMHYDEELERTTSEALAPEHWVDLTLADRVRRLVGIGVDSYRANRGLWRAVLIHTSSNPKIVTEEHRQRRLDMVAAFVALLLDCQHEMRHPQPEQAAHFCLVLLFATCKDQILLADRSHGTTKMSDEQLKDQLTRTLQSLLGLQV